jgi:hypothetical protein
MADPKESENGWERWRGGVDSRLNDIRTDTAEIKDTLADHIKDEGVRLNVILGTSLTIAGAGVIALVVFLLNK